MYMNEKLVLKSKKVKDHISAENLKILKPSILHYRTRSLKMSYLPHPWEFVNGN